MKYLSDCSLSDIATQIKNRKLSPSKLIDQLCNRLDNWDGIVKAFLPESDRRSRLHHDLEKLNHTFPDPDKRPILFGIPIAVKDIFVAEGFETKGGSNLPAKEFEGKEAKSVTLLKNAGALVMGKTVTTEFAYFDPGPTCNPHNILHTPGGSSSGSAAAVAAGFCPLALGTQTIGSISRPAAFCGVIGFKPSYGRIPLDGVIPFSKSVDHIGFFTQDLIGAEIAASVLCDNWDVNNSSNQVKPVLGIPKGKYLQQASQEIITSFDKITEKLSKLDYQVLEIPVFDKIDLINYQHTLINAFEFAEVHRKWFQKHRNKYHKASVELIERGMKISVKDVKIAKENRFKLRAELERLQKDYGFDLWISPSAPTIAPRGLSSTGSPIMNLPWTFAGIPTISIPFGSVNSLPIGLQFSGKFNNDEILFQQIQKIEQLISLIKNFF